MKFFLKQLSFAIETHNYTSLRYVPLILAVSLVLALPVQSQELSGPVDLVNPRIGGISHVLMPTFPTVHRPFGMVRFYPVTSPGISDSYLGGRIYGFPLNRPEHRGRAAITVMPVSGLKSLQNPNLSSAIDHDFEKVTPYQYSVLLEDDNITVDFAPTERCGFYQFSPESSKDLVLVFQTTDDGIFDLKNEQNLFGSEAFNGIREYVNIRFDRPVKLSGYVDDWSWDTFRTLHPLRFLICPDREVDMIKSYILMGEQSGWMPTFPQVSGDAKCMIGHHQAAIIAEGGNIILKMASRPLTSDLNVKRNMYIYITPIEPITK